MDLVSHFKELFESIPDYRKLVFLKNLTKDDVDSLNECGFLKSDNIRRCVEPKKYIELKNEDHHDYIKYQEESILERNLVKKTDEKIFRYEV